jgi:ubiquinone/menaquinone biosynthesis C-methylase UbiE
MYSKYPYPSPTVGGSLLYDVANLFYLLCEKDDLNRKKILDAGCGTGQRVLGFAKRYPKAEFQGIDLTDASLEVANQLARKHGISNISFKKRNILNLNLDERFDFIVSTGVVHHLEDPQRGLRNLCNHLSSEGVICLWYYHPFGEFDRLVGRELLLTLWDIQRSDLLKGQRIMDQLQLKLLPQQYGASATQKERDRSQLSINADAFMHPIVDAYRFDEAMGMFRTCDVDWVAINGINTPETMKLIDLMQVEEKGRELCLSDAELFETEELSDLYRSLSKIDQLKAIELATKPTGFTIMAGKKDSFKKLGQRIAGNTILKEDLPEPYPRLLRVS